MEINRRYYFQSDPRKRLSSLGIQGLSCLCLLFCSSYEISCKKGWLLQCVVRVYCGGALVYRSHTSERTNWWRRRLVGGGSHLWYPLTAECHVLICVKFIICSVTVLIQIKSAGLLRKWKRVDHHARVEPLLQKLCDQVFSELHYISHILIVFTKK
jgi:hypothetical protein